MKDQKVFLCFAATCFLSIGASAFNRIDLAKVDKGIRCMGEAMGPAACSADQQYALQTGCINQEEYAMLVRENLAPYCSRYNNKVTGVCACGCFAIGTRMHVAEYASQSIAVVPIEMVVEFSNDYLIMAMKEDATLSALGFESMAIRRTTQGPELGSLIYIRTKGGREIGLTKNHAVLLANGEMVEAKAVRVGFSLLSSDGKADNVVAVKKRKANGNVYNLLVDAKGNQGHLVIAEDLVVGDLAWQNSLASELYSVRVRQ